MASLADLIWGEGDDLNEVNLNKRAKVIHDRLTALEGFVPDWQAQVAALITVALDRIDTALMPAYEAILGLAQLGALFTGTSTSSVTVGAGPRIFTVGASEAERLLFAPAATLGVSVTGDPTVAMVGRFVSYDRETGALEIVVEETAGSGTHSAWTITPAVPAALLTELAGAVILAADNTWSGAQSFGGEVTLAAGVEMTDTARDSIRTALGLGTAAFTAAADYAPASSVIGDINPGQLLGRAAGGDAGPLQALSATNAAAVIAAAGRFLELAGGLMEGSLSFKGSAAQEYGARLTRFSGANGDLNIATRGTGILRLIAEEAGSIVLSTSGTRRLRVEATGEVIADGLSMAAEFRTSSVTIANNAVFNFVPRGTTGVLTISSSLATIACELYFRCNSIPDTRMIAAPAGNVVDLATGGQTGTTGTVGRFRVSALDDGRLSFENRTGSAVQINYTIRS